METRHEYGWMSTGMFTILVYPEGAMGDDQPLGVLKLPVEEAYALADAINERRQKVQVALKPEIIEKVVEAARESVEQPEPYAPSKRPRIPVAPRAKFVEKWARAHGRVINTAEAALYVQAHEPNASSNVDQIAKHLRQILAKDERFRKRDDTTWVLRGPGRPRKVAE